MANSYGRYIAGDLNDLSRALGALIGIAQGLICDGRLNDEEIEFLNRWLRENTAISSTWPGDVIHARLRDVLADGVATDSERQYLIGTLQELVGGTSQSLAAPQHVTELAFDEVDHVNFEQQNFCLTGEFIYGPRDVCEATIQSRGGVVTSVTRKLRYLVVGMRGSKEWKHGSFGTKFEKAMQYKRGGCPILIVRENQWAASL